MTEDHYNNKEEENDFVNTIKKCQEIENTEDPITEPYRSKYESRELLIKLRERTKDLVKIARIDCKLGINYYLTEENTTAEKHLIQGLKKLEGDESWIALERLWEVQDFEGMSAIPNPKISNDGLLDAAEGYNFLGILWSQRCDGTEQACGYLERAKTILDKASLGENDSALVYTNTLYYLAQVYTALGNGEKGSALCAETLYRQNKYLQDFDSVRWIKDAVGVSLYFTHLGHTRQAAHCLNAALRAVKPEDDEASADIQRGIGALYLAVLEHCVLRQRDNFQGENAWSDPAIQSKLFIEDRLDDNSESDILVPKATSEIQTFEDAREVFLAGNNAMENAKKYFVLDGFVSDHIKILRSQSSFYKFLAFFEIDLKRKLAMQTRREKLLSDLLETLNPTLFGAELQEISFELGEIANEKLTLVSESIVEHCSGRHEITLPEDIKKINTNSMLVIKYFAFYGKRFKEAVIEEGDDIEAAYAPFAMSLFWIAHAYHKMIPPSRDSFAQAKTLLLHQSLKYFEESLKIMKQYIPKSSMTCKVEREICEDMVALLPQQIDQVNGMYS